jgi:hypothetical protein
MAAEDPRMSKYPAGKRKHVTLMIAQQLEKIIHLKVAKAELWL